MKMPNEYYCNRFHSLEEATINLTVEPDSGGNLIEIRVKRDKTGTRTVDSPSGYAEPEKILQVLATELTLLDYSTFRHSSKIAPSSEAEHSRRYLVSRTSHLCGKRWK